MVQYLVIDVGFIQTRHGRMIGIRSVRGSHVMMSLGVLVWRHRFTLMHNAVQHLVGRVHGHGEPSEQAHREAEADGTTHRLNVPDRVGRDKAALVASQTCAYGIEAVCERMLTVHCVSYTAAKNALVHTSGND